MSKNKQSSVEWLMNQLTSTWYDKNSVKDIFEQAKAMHKEEIAQAFDDGDYNYFYSRKTGNDFVNGNEYYIEKFGDNNE